MVLHLCDIKFMYHVIISLRWNPFLFFFYFFFLFEENYVAKMRKMTVYTFETRISWKSMDQSGTRNVLRRRGTPWESEKEREETASWLVRRVQKLQHTRYEKTFGEKLFRSISISCIFGEYNFFLIIIFNLHNRYFKQVLEFESSKYTWNVLDRKERFIILEATWDR